TMGWKTPEYALKGLGASIAAALPFVGGFASWFFQAAVAGLLGLVVGAAADPLAVHGYKPAAKALGRVFSRRAKA
ncbi:MAG: hypothetical protein K2Q06_07790, partial [Parvularculaceae bacterium]|nr:hypothetical protein [Parvularculaceae bacterium]